MSGMASKITGALPTHLKPNGGEFEKRHHGKTQSHVVRFSLLMHCSSHGVSSPVTANPFSMPEVDGIPPESLARIELHSQFPETCFRSYLELYEASTGGLVPVTKTNTTVLDPLSHTDNQVNGCGSRVLHS